MPLTTFPTFSDSPLWILEASSPSCQAAKVTAAPRLAESSQVFPTVEIKKSKKTQVDLYFLQFWFGFQDFSPCLLSSPAVARDVFRGGDTGVLRAE